MYNVLGKRSVNHSLDCRVQNVSPERVQRHDNIARNVHLELCHTFGLVGKIKWYNHKPASAVENDRVKIMWDFNIQTDHVIQHKAWHSCAVQNVSRKCHLTDVVPGNKWIELKEQEKIGS